MGWTKWRGLARGDNWSDEFCDYDGPCVYELGTGGPRGGSIQIHYVGESSNERRRMYQYGSTGSHLDKIIRWHLKEGWTIYYRSFAVKSKKQAVTMQNNILAKFKYDWNERRNRD